MVERQNSREYRQGPRQFLTRMVAHPVQKLASLLLAIGAWWYVQGGQVTEVKLRAAIEWKLPPGLATTEPLPQSVTLSLKGSRSAIRRAQHAEVHLSADLSEIQVGEHTVELASLDPQGLTQGVNITAWSPSSVRLVLDEESVRKVRVKLVTVGDPPSGYSVIRSSIEPGVVEVKGSRIVTSQLLDVSTKPVDVSGLMGDFDAPVELDLPWGVEPAGGTQVRCHIDVEPVVERRVFEDIPLVVRNSAFGSTTTTVSVTLQGPTAELRAIDPTQVAALVELPDDAIRSRYEVAFGPKEGVRIAVVHPAMDAVRVLSVRPSVIEVSKR